MAVLVVFLLLGAGAPRAAPDVLEEALEAGARDAVSRLVKADPRAGKRYFARKAEKLLRLRRSGATTEKLSSRLDLLCRVFKEDLGETYLADFLDTYRSWAPADIQAKFACDEKANKAARLSSSGAVPEARSLLTAALGEYRRLGHTMGITGSTLLLGQCELRIGRLAEARRLYREALAVARRARYRSHVVKSLSNLGSLAKRQGRLDEAREAYTEYLQWAREGRDQPGESRALANLADVAAQQGRARTALSLYGRALALPGRDRAAEAVMHYGMGKAYHTQGNYSAAYRSYQAALEKTPSQPLKAAILDSLGVLRAAQGDTDRALEVFRQALALDRKHRRTSAALTTTHNMARVYAVKEEYDTAEQLFTEALEGARGLKDRALEAQIRANLGVMARNRKDYEKALRQFSETLAIFKEIDDRKGCADVMNHAGTCLLKLGKLREAAASFGEARKLQDAIRYHRGRAVALVGLGKVAMKQGELQTAEGYLKTALEAVDKQRAHVISARYRDLFLEVADLAEGFSVYADVLVRRAKPAEAFLVAERSKVQGLLAELLITGAEKRRVPAELAEREAELREEAAELRRKLTAASSGDRVQLTGAFDANERAYSAVLEEIWSRVPRNVVPPVPEYTALRAFVSDLDVAVAEFLLGEETSYLFVLCGNELEVFTVPGQEELEGLVKRFRQELRTPAGDVRPVASELGKLLLSEAWPVIAQAKALVVVPDGPLHGIPFGVLLVEGGSYLIERMPVAYWPSVAFAMGNRGEGAARRRQAGAAAFGDPAYPASGVLDPRLSRGGRVNLPQLVASRSEAVKVAEILGVKAVVRQEATEAALKRVLPAVRVLHIASHAYIHPEDSHLSALFLRPGDGEDGVFELRELTDAPGELVVLSACDSGTGELVRGEGFLGFGRAFFQAGVRSLVLSLWQVNDQSSATLMPLFWQRLRSGRCVCAALREAKLAYLREARAGRVAVRAGTERGPFRTVKRKKIRPDHPYFWAGFVALGCSQEPLFPADR